MRLPPKWEAFLFQAMRRANYLGRRRLRPGVRTAAGIAFVIGGIFGFLPILGFWMIPVGLLLIALDLPTLRRRITRWIPHWKRRVNGG